MDKLSEGAALIISAIAKATLTTEECYAIQNAIRDKRKSMQNTTIATLKYAYGVGTRVETVGLSPKYINGRQGVIKKIATSRCIVVFDEPLGGKFGSMREVRIPLACLKIVEAPSHITAKPLMAFAGGE